MFIWNANYRNKTMDTHACATNCHGFKIRPQRDVTYADLISICRDLNETFNYEYSFAPEPITDGFIYYKNFHNASSFGRAYKCMRLSSNRIKWISDEATIFDEWRECNDIFLKKKEQSYKNVYYVTLKAFNGAPGWTLDELKTFKQVFERNSIKVSCMPPAFHLDYGKYRKRYSFPWERKTDPTSERACKRSKPSSKFAFQ